jgi:hypothetical protein
MSSAKIDELVVRRLVVQKEENGPRILAEASDLGTFLWVMPSDDSGQIGLIAQHGLPPHILLWGKGNKYPALAISTDKDGKFYFQVPEGDGCEHFPLDWIKHITNIGPDQLISLAK